MVNGIRTIYPTDGLNKRLGLKFRSGFRVRQETPKEGRKHQPKRCEYEDNSPNTCGEQINKFF